MTKPSTGQIARVFRTLAAEPRVRIVLLLRGRSLCVQALARALGVSQAAVSQHLRILRDADLVIPEKKGLFVHYRLNEKRLAHWRRIAEGLLVLPSPPGAKASKNKSARASEEVTSCARTRKAVRSRTS